MSLADRIRTLDLSLFDSIETQSILQDKEAWLAIQDYLRQKEYVYLEIGSHLGGSIQQHLIDPQCRRIFSIDKRPLHQPDDRGKTYDYPDNSTARMLDNLRNVDASQLHKLTCLDQDASQVPLEVIDSAPHFCLIDGEHTKQAVLSDFQFCIQVCHPDAILAFHDINVVWPAVREIIATLSKTKVPFSCLKFSGLLFGILLRNGQSLALHPWVAKNSRNGKAWLDKK